MSSTIAENQFSFQESRRKYHEAKQLKHEKFLQTVSVCKQERKELLEQCMNSLTMSMACTEHVADETSVEMDQQLLKLCYTQAED